MIYIFFSISIIFSFLCSIWEAVLLSIPPAQVEIQHQKGGRVGKLLKEYKDNIDRPLAAILTLNTIAHTVGAIGVGAEAAKMWGNTPMATIVVPVLMTLGILILSEIIPKTLGATYWKSWIPFTITSLNIIVTALWPLVWVSQLITKALKKEGDKSVLSRADFSAMTDIGLKEGLFQQNESKIIQNLLRFNTIRAKDVMTPRTVVIAANEEMSIADFYAENKDLRFSRIPIYEETKDQINGLVLKDVVLASLVNDNGDALLKSIKRDIMVITEKMDLPTLFHQLTESREHIALVVDEFGGMAGIVTMEDVIETLLGLEIVDEFDNIEDMQALARKKWEARAQKMGLINKAEDKKPNSL